MRISDWSSDVCSSDLRRHRLSNGLSCRRPDPRPPRCALSQRYATLSRADRRTRPPRCLTHTGGASYAPPSLRGSMATIFAPSASDLVELEELADRFGVFLDLHLDVSETGAPFIRSEAHTS